MNSTIYLEALMTGLSVGAYCLPYCFPFLATYMSAEQRSFIRNCTLLFYFLLGRLAGYALFGLVFGYLGETIKGRFVSILSDLSLVVISIVLLLNMTGLIKHKTHVCLVPKYQSRNAFVMGFLLGINICPPFLLSLAYVFSLHNVMQSLLYFLVFYAVSSMYFLPMIFVGLLGKVAEFRKVARLAGIASSIVFMVYGVYSLFHHWQP